MNLELVRTRSAASRPRHRRVQPTGASTRVMVRSATAGDAAALHTLIAAHREEGRLLPRELSELSAHAPRFVVAVRGRIVGCAELAPLTGRVAEIRSLVVDRRARSLGIGRALVAELRQRARVAGFEELCAFTHDAAFFVQMGFSMVPHTWVPEKIARDCNSCALFRRCGQHALMLTLADPRASRPRTLVPLATLGG